MGKPSRSHGSHHRRQGGTQHGNRSRGGNQQHGSRGHQHSSSASSETCFDKQLFDFIIVVDFECTCERDQRSYPNEIIEFPAILIDVRDGGKILKSRSFRSYAKPWRNPRLTKFCTDLTGISQGDVEMAPDLQTVVKKFEKWYNDTIPLGAKVMLATDGPWDFKNFILNGAVKRDHVAFPTLFYEYIDVRTTYANYFNRGHAMKLDKMMRKMELRFEGRPHCGFDDAVNIARLAVAMMRQGCVFSFIVAMPLDEDPFHYQLPSTPLYRRQPEGTSGVVARAHVEEQAKATFGDAYYKYGGSTFKGLGGVTDMMTGLNDPKYIYVDQEVYVTEADIPPPVDVDALIALLPSVSDDSSSCSDDDDDSNSDDDHESGDEGEQKKDKNHDREDGNTEDASSSSSSSSSSATSPPEEQESTVELARAARRDDRHYRREDRQKLIDDIHRRYAEREEERREMRAKIAAGAKITVKRKVLKPAKSSKPSWCSKVFDALQLIIGIGLGLLLAVIAKIFLLPTDSHRVEEMS